MADEKEKMNGGGVYVEMSSNENGDYLRHRHRQQEQEQEGEEDEIGDHVYGVLHRLVSMILFPASSSSPAPPLFQRIKISLQENVPRFPEASRNTSRNVLRWTRSGTPLRALLVISVGTITLMSLTGLLVFMLFFLAATVNAIIVSLLISLAAAGGFLAIFFACLTAIYIGALSVAVFVISATTISAVIAVLITTGWIGFFWTVWLATKKSVGLAKHSLTVTGSALSAYSYTRHGGHHYVPDKGSD